MPSLPLLQVLLKRARKAGEALRRSAYTEVDQLGEGKVPLPGDLTAWEGLAAGEWGAGVGIS